MYFVLVIFAFFVIYIFIRVKSRNKNPSISKQLAKSRKPTLDSVVCAISVLGGSISLGHGKSTTIESTVCFGQYIKSTKSIEGEAGERALCLICMCFSDIVSKITSEQFEISSASSLLRILGEDNESAIGHSINDYNADRELASKVYDAVLFYICFPSKTNLGVIDETYNVVRGIYASRLQ